ncbi:MAG: tetratricopeptide repeat protein [Oligoflexales bacterium]|nr:tetratricopeptide repeat protein [Oligoflexales bacterium]
MKLPERVKSEQFQSKQLTIVVFISILSGCASSASEKTLQNDMFNLQTRMMKVEESLHGKNIVDEFNVKIAATETKLDQINMEIQKIKGELGALKIGVTTGLLPGTDPAQEGSIAYAINKVNTRLDAVELAQTEILAAIDKASTETPKPKEAAKEKTAESDTAKDTDEIKNLVQLKSAYSKKKYTLVTESAGAVLGKETKKNREEVLFLHAESLFKLSKFSDAALKFNDLIEKYPSSKRNSLARLRVGDCFRRLGDEATATLYYKDVIKYNPDSSEAKEAKSKLDKQKKKH